MFSFSALALAVGISLASNPSFAFNEFSGASFWYYDQNDRVQMATELANKIKASYSLWDTKNQQLGSANPAYLDQYSQHYINTERKYGNETDELAQTRSNMEFLDRARAYVAGFKDTHFGLRAATARPPITLGFVMSKVGKKYIITRVAKSLMAKAAASNFEPTLNQIAIGDEVVSYDGKPIAEAAQGLRPYISASSEPFRESEALFSLTYRAFMYPKNQNNTVDVDIVHAGADTLVHRYRLQWFYGKNQRGDAATLFKDANIPSFAELQQVWDIESRTLRPIATFFESYADKTTQRLFNVKEYVNSSSTDGETAIRTGLLIVDNRNYGFLQLNTFDAPKVKLGTVETPYLDAVRNAVLEFKKIGGAQPLPLILDIRNNGGGDLSFPPGILAALAPAKSSFSSLSMGYRLTRYVRQVEADWYNTGTYVSYELGGGANSEDFHKLFTDAVARHSAETDAFQYQSAKVDPKVGGYEGKIVAWVSPYCISACDVFANLLKTNHRATLMGTQTNGTGAGFHGTLDIKPEWQDSFNVLQTKIPVVLFGSPGGSAEQNIFPGKTVELNTEGKPVVADVPYEQTLEDITSGSSGWFKKTVELLKY